MIGLYIFSTGGSCTWVIFTFPVELKIVSIIQIQIRVILGHTRIKEIKLDERVVTTRFNMVNTNPTFLPKDLLKS